MTERAGDEQRRCALLIRPVDLRAFVQQQPRCIDEAIFAGDEQRRHPVLRRPINLFRAALQQQQRRVEATVCERVIQNRTICPIRIGAVRET